MFFLGSINKSLTYDIYLRKLTDSENGNIYVLDIYDSYKNIITITIDEEMAPMFKRDLIRSLEIIEGGIEI